MALPHAREARPFYQSAYQRLEDAQFLHAADRTTGAIYLAGYSVECMLKVLILNSVPPGERSDILASFRGAKAHDYEWLKAKYRQHGGPTFPSRIAKNFSLIDTWTTDLRYQAGAIRRADAEAFLKATDAIMKWADGRL